MGVKDEQLQESHWLQQKIQEQLNTVSADLEDLTYQNSRLADTISYLNNQGQTNEAKSAQEIAYLKEIIDKMENSELHSQNQMKARCLVRLTSSNNRFMGMAFRQAMVWTRDEVASDVKMFEKCRGIANRMSDASVRLMGSGYNGLYANYNAKRGNLRTKLKWLLKTLTNSDLMNLTRAYGALKERKLMLDGVGFGDRVERKVQLVKRITNQSFNLQVMAVNNLREFLRAEREKHYLACLKYEQEMKDKTRVLKRIMDGNARAMSSGFKTAHQYTLDAVAKDRHKATKHRGILRRILDSNIRLMAQGYNKLLEKAKSRKQTMKTKLRNLLKSFKDKDLGYMITAYNTLKQRCRMLSGEGMGLATMKKVS
jgi:hypothetical protein